MQNNLQIWKEHLDSNQAFTTPLPEIIADMVKTIPNDEIPQKMKLLMLKSKYLFQTQKKIEKSQMLYRILFQM